jgi:hypothetical protein
VRSPAVVVTDVATEDVLELAAAEDQQPIEALASDAADPALHVGVRVRRSFASAGSDVRTLAHKWCPKSARPIVKATANVR